MINNAHKITKFNSFTPIIAGVMPNDSNVEFFANMEKRSTFWIQNGNVRRFTDLPVKYFELLNEKYKEHPKAKAFLSSVTKNYSRQIELFAYYLFGDLDTTPDILNGKLTQPENFRDSENCPSLVWNFKKIKINGKALTPREILISDMFSKDLPDKAIASALNLSHSHFDVVKRSLFEKADVSTKTAYIMKALTQKVIRK